MFSDLHLPATASTAPRAIRVAVIGSGISGLAAAHTLHGFADVTLYEGGGHFGGQARTTDITLPDARGEPIRFGVDTGFLVFNERAHPNLWMLLSSLQVPIAKSDASISVRIDGAAPGGGQLEWSSHDLSSVFAQRRNLASPRFLRMLADIARFNRVATRLAQKGEDLGEHSPLLQPLGEFLRAHRFSNEFRDWCFLPMMCGIGGIPIDQAPAFPVATMVRLFHICGLLQIADRPTWYSVAGGARQYVKKIVATLPDRRLGQPVLQVLRDAEGARVVTEGRVERFDAVVMACHSDQALRLLGAEATRNEREVLGALRYQSNRTVLHTDASVLPENPRARAAWNLEHSPLLGRSSARIGLHGLINRLQPLPVAAPVVISLNPQREIASDRILAEYADERPLFDLAALRAQARVNELQGPCHTWFAGAWTGQGFHEDGLKSGLGAARAIIDRYGLVPSETRGQALRHALPGVFG